MATISYPANGTGGLTDVQWSKMYNSPDGIVNDYTGDMGGVQFISATNAVRVLAPLMMRVNGYTLEVTADHEIGTTLPTAAGNYFVLAQYDPALNTPDANGAVRPEGPCRIILTANPDTSGGKAHALIARLIRASNGAAPSIVYHAQRIGDNFSVNTMPAAKLANPEQIYAGWDHPVGSRAYEVTTGEEYVKLVNNDGGTYWEPQSLRGPFNIPAPAGLVAQAADETAQYFYTSNRGMVHLEGTLKRSSGANLVNGSDVVLGTLPESARPKKDGRWPVGLKLVGAGWETGHVRVSRDGVILLYDPNGTPNVVFVDLSSISYRTR